MAEKKIVYKTFDKEESRVVNLVMKGLFLCHRLAEQSATHALAVMPAFLSKDFVEARLQIQQAKARLDDLSAMFETMEENGCFSSTEKKESEE